MLKSENLYKPIYFETADNGVDPQGGGWPLLAEWVEVWRHLGYKHTWGRILTTRVEAYYYRAYYSNTAAGGVKDPAPNSLQALQHACKLYNTLKKRSTKRNEHTMSRNESM